MVSRLAALCGCAALSSASNIVFMLTDDQDMRLGASSDYTAWGSVAAQKNVQKLLMQDGAAMTNFFVNTPICCPSRTEFFTGRYFHNVRGKDGAGCMHANTTDVGTSDGLFGMFADAGYEVGVFGKTTNDQGSQLARIAKTGSATWIDSPIDYNDYDGLTYFRYDKAAGQNTSVEKLNPNDPRFGSVYQTSQIGNRSALWLDSVAKTGKKFFLYLGPHAPHFPATPAPWYENAFPDHAAPRTPNYNAASPDKVRHIRQNPSMSELIECWEDQHFRDRWRTLLSVDDLLATVYAKLEEHKLIDDTYIVYSSDHGYKLGQWRVPTSKQHPYDTDVRVPLFVRGPGISPGSVHHDVTGNVDLLPTLAELAGLTTTGRDGRSFASLLLGKADSNPKPRRESWLNEYESVGTYYSDHSAIWTPGNKEICGGKLPNSPTGEIPGSECKASNETGAGNCYFLDSIASNNFLALRTINATHDTQYIEWGSSENWISGWTQPPIHYEYYNLTQDPYQLHNLFRSLPRTVQASLHSSLRDYYACKEGSCP